MADVPADSGDAQKPAASESESNEHTAAEEDDEDAKSSDEEDDGEEEDEPKLKYARMTGSLSALYRNGDATSCFLVAGDKMFIGTHNGNIHVISLPSFQSLRVYCAHKASVTCISISPFPPPVATTRPEAVHRVVTEVQNTPKKPSSVTSGSSTTPRTPKPKAQIQVLPNSPSNAIYIATSSMDGKVCVASLVDMKDVQLRDFARPVQAIAISPDYKNDRTYLSGGLAGNLVLTVGGKSGASEISSTTGTAAATASGWLGTIGLGTNAGKDTILHSGEGTISTIKWSLSGKFVVWINEQGIKIMRSNLHLESADSESAWKRIAHVDRPQEDGWEEMASVWKGRAEWIDEKNLETDDDKRPEALFSPAKGKLKQVVTKSNKRVEKLLIGWGGTVWIINVHPGGVGVGKHVGERTVGRAEIVKILRMDCIISGLSLYTPSLLLVLAYITPDEEEQEAEKREPQKGHKSKASTTSTGSEPSGGIRRRQNALSPELRLIDLISSEELDPDGLTVSRFERLSASDYHLGILPASRDAPMVATSRGALETLGGMGSGMWNATVNATSLLSSAASVRSTGSKSDGESGSKIASIAGSLRTPGRALNIAHPNMAAPGMKIFIHSPYDCILATKRDLSDHLSWLMEQFKYQQAWELIDEHPEIIFFSLETVAEIGSEKGERSSDDFYDEAASAGDSVSRLINSSVEKEKRRIGELWIQQLVAQDSWVTAGQVCGKVLGTSSRWEHWVWTFAGANKFDEITNYIPTTQLHPPLPSTIYEVVLGHYIAQNRPRLRELLDLWPPELFDIRAVTTALENQLAYRDVREDSIEGGQKGRDWRIVKECMGKLFVADGRPRDALKCYVQLQDADTAMGLIRDYHLIDAVSDDIPSFILLRVSKEQMRSASKAELEEATSEPINLLVLEAQRGLVHPEDVVKQLEEKDLPLYLFFYLRLLWRGTGSVHPGDKSAKLADESHSLVDSFADLAVQLFAAYDRPILMDFLKSSTSYTFEMASAVCEEQDCIPELVYLYSKTGQTKRALFLIIDRLADVSQAIAFAKQQDDTDLWEDLLRYSMDKPRFIRGLLEEVGTAIDPITLVRRIPEGLQIEGLRDGLSRMIKEYEIQHSISSGVARVLRGEVSAAQITLRTGQQKAVKFDIVHKSPEHIDAAASDIVVPVEGGLKTTLKQAPKPGHCVSCGEPFSEDSKDTLVAFACGHVFHLPHLLSTLYPDRPPTPPMVELDENGEFVQRHGVGAKVTHARLLKDKIVGGCPVCSVGNLA